MAQLRCIYLRVLFQCIRTQVFVKLISLFFPVHSKPKLCFTLRFVQRPLPDLKVVLWVNAAAAVQPKKVSDAACL